MFCCFFVLLYEYWREERDTQKKHTYKPSEMLLFRYKGDENKLKKS